MPITTEALFSIDADTLEGQAGSFYQNAGNLNAGSLLDARVAASNVTQHQAALSITESQISDLQSYALSSHNHTLDSLSNVTITTNTTGEILVWNGTAWINQTLSEAGVAASSHNHDASEINSGTLSSARLSGSYTITNLGSAATWTTGRTISLTGNVTGTSAAFNGSANLSFAATIANNAVTNAQLADVPTQTFKGRTTAATGDPEDLTIAQAKTMLNLTGTNSGDQTITLTGDVTGSGTGSFAATIANDAVTNVKLANMVQSTVKGRASGAGTGDPADLTAAQLITILTAADGAGSLLDADLLDGNEASAFALSGHNHDATYLKLTGGTLSGALSAPQLDVDNIRLDGNTISTTDTNGNLTLAPNGTGEVIISNNLTVNGTTTTVNSNEVNIGDNIIVLNSDETGVPSQDGGIEIERGTSTNARLLFEESSDLWKLDPGTGTLSKILTSLDVGAGNGLDADLLDGVQGSGYALSGHNHDADYVNVTGDTMTGALTIDASSTTPLTIDGGTSPTVELKELGVSKGTWGSVSDSLRFSNVVNSGSISFLTKNAVGTTQTVINCAGATGSVNFYYDNAIQAQTISGGFRVNNGLLDLLGTGRITGVDTVSAATDAVNKTYVDTNFLGIGAKAADSELLDGIDSTSFLRSDADDTTSGTINLTGVGKVLAFGSRTDPLIHFWSNTFTAGIQNSTLYFRTAETFSIHADGVHSDTENDPGAGGTNMLRLKQTGAIFEVFGNKVWHAGNDGTGSGLDADTVDGLQALSFQRRYRVSVQTGGTPQWMKVGVFTAGQSGQVIHIHYTGNQGYNALNTQNYILHIYFKTSNGSSVDANGFAGDCHWYQEGPGVANTFEVKWVADAAGTAATNYTLYIYGQTYTLDDHYTVDVRHDLQVWADSQAIGQADPGAGSSTVCVGTNTFSIRSPVALQSAVCTVGGNQVLTIADEGSGNGLDADTVDGIQGSQFLRNDQSGTFVGDLTIDSSTLDGLILEKTLDRAIVFKSGSTVQARIEQYDSDGLYFSNYDPGDFVVLSAESASSGHYTLFYGDPEAEVELYYGGTCKLETFVDGIYFGNNALFAATQGMLSHNGTQLDLKSYTHGAPVILTGQDNAGANKFIVHGDPDGATWIYYAGSGKINTSSTGATINGDLTVSNGGIILQGTGRIQGVDTVSANTDAANKQYVDDNSGSHTLLSNSTVSAVASADFALSTSYSTFVIEMYDIKPSNDNTYIGVRFSFDNGSTFVSTGYDYNVLNRLINSTEANYASTNGSEIPTTATDANRSMGNAANEGMNWCRLVMFAGNASPALAPTIHGHSFNYDNATRANSAVIQGGSLPTYDRVDQIRVLVSAGTFSGTIKIYGAS